MLVMLTMILTTGEYRSGYVLVDEDAENHGNTVNNDSDDADNNVINAW